MAIFRCFEDYVAMIYSIKPKVGLWVSPVATGGFWGFNPPNKALSPPKWNMKHYKQIEILSIFRVSSPPHKPKAPPQKCKAPYWKLSGDGSVVNIYYH